MKQQVKAVNDIRLYGITIPKGSIGYRTRWSPRLSHLKSSISKCVRFPTYLRHSFVINSDEIIDL